MTVKLYNSLTHQIEEFAPHTPPKVEMFVCGPTVYDLVHIGNARTFTIFDVLAKWLRHHGFEVTYLQNITDIDDKIINRGQADGIDPLALAQHFSDEFQADMAKLGNDATNGYVRATEHIDQVISQVKSLRDKKFAYLIEGDGWYFDLSRFPDYGKLSGRTTEQDHDAVSRIDENPNKKNAGDFVLWKLSKPGEPVWQDEELGDGRPGWHIEDTAMTEHHFGPQYDLHGGGMDLMFPHHEAEIAQQEAASGLVPFVRHWVHAGFLEQKGSKMSKSLGNIVSLRDALAHWSAEALRLFFLGAHYRGPLTLDEQSLKAAQAGVARIGEFVARLDHSHATSSSSPDAQHAIHTSQKLFGESLDDDFNTPQAIAAVFQLIRNSNPLIDAGTMSAKDIADIRDFLAIVQRTLGIVPANHLEISAEGARLVKEREMARETKDYRRADELRQTLLQQGWSIDDTPYGPLVKKR